MHALRLLLIIEKYLKGNTMRTLFRLMYGAMLLLIALLYAETHDHTAKSTHHKSTDIESIRSAYGLYSPDDYRPGINTQDFTSDAAMTDAIKGTAVYDLAAVSLGYKHVMLETPNECAKAMEYDTTLASLLNEKSLCYAEFDLFSVPVIYAPEHRYTALLLHKHLMLLDMPEAHDEHHPNDSMSHDYIVGVCLGYPHEDIDIFFQRCAFNDTYDIWPEDSIEAREQFNQFLVNEWPYDDEVKLARAKDAAQAWIDAHTSIKQLEDDIRAIQDTYPRLRIVHDQPFKELLTRGKSPIRTWLHRCLSSMRCWTHRLQHAMYSCN